MKKLLPVIAVMAIGAATPAFANMNHTHDSWMNHYNQSFKEMDTDGDGVISQDEYMDHMQDKFDAMDANGDGKLSKAEMMNYKKKEWAKKGGKRHTGSATESKGTHAENSGTRSPNTPMPNVDRADTSNDAKTNAPSSDNH